MKILTDNFFQADMIPIVMDLPRAGQPVESGVMLSVQAEPVIGRLQAAVAAVIAALPQPIRRSADLARILSMDRSQAWQMYRMATSPEPLAAVQFILSAVTMKRFLAVAEDKGVDASLTETAAEAFAAYEALVEAHAKDRASFNSMIVDLQGAGTNKEDLKHKRAAYRANRHLYGVHAAAIIQPVFIHPSRIDPDGPDMVSVIGMIDIQQTRANTNLLNEILVSHTVPSKRESYVYRPLPPVKKPADELRCEDYLLKEFCSNPLPEFRTLADANMLLTQVHSRVMGTAGSSTYFFAHSSENPPAPPDDASQTVIDTVIAVPAEVFVRDIWIHKSYWSTLRPSLQVSGRRTRLYSLLANMTDDDLATEEQLVDLGVSGDGTGGIHKAFLPEMPRYADLVRHVTRSMNWNIDEFYAIRCRIEYPIMHARVRIFLHMP